MEAVRQQPSRDVNQTLPCGRPIVLAEPCNVPAELAWGGDGGGGGGKTAAKRGQTVSRVSISHTPFECRHTRRMSASWVWRIVTYEDSQDNHDSMR
eukprot:6211919-Pleurochrysis_carterae.AAC.2